MIGMNGKEFLVLLILGLIASLVEHFLIRYRVLGSVDGFFMKWTTGWFGAWLGSPVLGHWWFRIGNVYVIPALIGAFVAAFAFAATCRAEARILAAKQA